MSNIYIVNVHAKDAVQQHLVRAKTRAAATNFIAGRFVTARRPTQDELVSAVTAGAVVVDAKAPEGPPEPTSEPIDCATNAEGPGHDWY